MLPTETTIMKVTISQKTVNSLIYYYVPSREVTIVPGHHGDGVEKAATPFPGCHFQFSPFA
jgi:hypothetical protein